MADPKGNWLGTDEPEKKTGTNRDDFLIAGGGDDTLYGMAGDDQINGQRGADVVFGGDGKDRLYISGTDRVSGGRGADVFVFLDHSQFSDIADAGTARIKDFDAVGRIHDQVDLFAFQVTWDDRDGDMSDGFAMEQRGADVVLKLECNDGSIATLVLQDTRKADLDAGDFIFTV